MISASDIITVDAGGRLFKTTRNTLESSGSLFFQALLGRTGTTLAGSAASTTSSRKRPRNTGSNSPTTTTTTTTVPSIFVDCDPDSFADVLYYMRRGRLAPHTQLDVAKLVQLQTEADFFSYQALTQACAAQLHKLETVVTQALPNDDNDNDDNENDDNSPPKAYSDNVIIGPLNPSTLIVLEPGQVLYIDSATLAGRCVLQRNGRLKLSEDGDEFSSSSSGDFQLGINAYNADNQDFTDFFCIAHVGMFIEEKQQQQQQHHQQQQAQPSLPGLGYRPPLNFTQSVQCCISYEETEGYVSLRVMGSADWHEHYWIGHPRAIPQLCWMPDMSTMTSSARPLKKARPASSSSSSGRDAEPSESARTALGLAALASQPGAAIASLATLGLALALLR